MWIDLTIQPGKSPLWPGSEQFSMVSQTNADCCNSHISMNLHCGTHIDAPKHFIINGKTIDQIPLEKLMGIVQIINVPDKTIDISHLQQISCKKVIFKTNNDMCKNFTESYCYLSSEAAQYLVELGVELVGTDYLSVEDYRDKQFKTHHILLSHEVIIMESLNTKMLDRAYYYMIALPMLITAEASPCRVIAFPCDASTKISQIPNHQACLH